MASITSAYETVINMNKRVFAFVKFRINDGVAQNPRYNFKIDKKSIDNIDGTGNTTTMQTYLYLKYIYMSI